MQIFSILARTNQQILERASWETASNKYHFALYERKDAGKIPFLHCLSICNPFVWRHTYFRERKWKDNLKDGVNLNIFFSEGKADGRTRKVLWKLGQYGLCWLDTFFRSFMPNLDIGEWKENKIDFQLFGARIQTRTSPFFQTPISPKTIMSYVL